MDIMATADNLTQMGIIVSIISAAVIAIWRTIRYIFQKGVNAQSLISRIEDLEKWREEHTNDYKELLLSIKEMQEIKAKEHQAIMAKMGNMDKNIAVILEKLENHKNHA